MQVGQIGCQSELLLRRIQKHRFAVILKIMLLDLMKDTDEVQTILVFLLISEGELH